MMMKNTSFLISLALMVSSAAAFSSQQYDVTTSSSSASRIPSKRMMGNSNSDNNAPDDSRRQWLHTAATALVATTTATLTTTTTTTQPAWAAQGDYAKIEMPNVMQGLSDRANKQCLMESLGNRECLVYADDVGNFLYQGANANVLLGRVQTASQALGNVPALIETKKWSQVAGVLTGPMGELVRNMGLLADLSPNAAAAKKVVAQVKTDLYGINAAIERKDGALALKYHAAAEKDLVAFVKAL